MKKVMNSLFSAFLMYSKVPMPKVDWKAENRKYSFCFFPLVGVVIGAVFAGMWFLLDILDFNRFFSATILTAVSLVITGGIHLDGFCDTVDALSSWKDKDKKLEILKDSHVGAFAVIWLIMYIFVFVGGVSEIDNTTLLITVCSCFVSSRAVTVLLLSFTTNPKSEGMLYGFKQPMQQNSAVISAIFYCLICFVVIIFMNYFNALILIICTLLFIVSRRKAIKEFGGVTGDIAGWFLCRYELIFICSAVIFHKLSLLV